MNDTAVGQVIEIFTSGRMDHARLHNELMKAERRGVERAVRWFLRHLSGINEYEEIIRKSVDQLF